MKKMKKLGALLAASILSLGVGAFAACGDDNNDNGNDNAGAATDAYTLVVKDADGNVLQDVRVGICTYDETTHEKGTCLNPEKTDANGKVVFDANDGVEDGEVYTLNPIGDWEAQQTYVFKAYDEYTVVLIAK